MRFVVTYLPPKKKKKKQKQKKTPLEALQFQSKILFLKVHTFHEL